MNDTQDTLSDDRIVERVLAGECDLFKGLVERYLTVAQAVARSRVHSPSDVDDVVQEAFTKSYLSLDSLRNRERFGPWLAAITRRICGDFAKKAARRAEREREAQRRPLPFPPSPEQRELEALVRGQVSQLAPELREAVLLRYFAGKSVREVAVLMEISAAAAAKRLQRAREALGEQLLETLGQGREDDARKRSRVADIAGVAAALHPPWETAGVAGGATAATSSTLAGMFKIGLIGVAALVLALGAFVAVRMAEEKPAGIETARIEEGVTGPAESGGANGESDADASRGFFEDLMAEANRLLAESAKLLAEADGLLAFSNEGDGGVPGGGVITGRAYELETGRGVQGATVFARLQLRGGADAPIQAVTDESGAYRFKGLAEGAYTLKASLFQSRGTSSRSSEAVQVSIEPGVEMSNIDLVFVRGLTVSGRLVDVSGKPIPNASVLPMVVGSSGHGNASTDKEGQFELLGYREGEQVFLHVLEDGYAGDYKGPFKVPATGLRNLELVVDPEAVLEGTIVDEGGRPCEGIKVFALADGNAPYPNSSMSNVSDAQGRFRMGRLAAGDYRLNLSPEDERGMQFDMKVPGTVAVAKGETITGIELVYGLPEGYTISGRVVDDQGRPVADATVNVLEGPSRDMRKTDNSGLFLLVGLREGTYSLLADHKRFGQVEIEEVATGTEGLEFVLSKRGRIEGTVIDATTGSPVTEFAIREPSRRFGRWGRAEFVAFRDSQGRFALNDIQPGNAALEVRAKGYAPAVHDGLALKPDGHLTGVQIRVTPSAALEGVVVDTDGRPVRDAMLFLDAFPERRHRAEESAAAASGPDGSFRVDSMPLDARLVLAFHPQHAEASAPVQRENGGIRPVEIRMAPGATLRGVIGSDVPFAHAPHVTLGIQCQTIVTDTASEDGAYELTGLPSGEVVVSACGRIGACPDHDTLKQVRTVFVHAGEPTEYDFDFQLWNTKVEGTITLNGAPPSDKVRLGLVYEGPDGERDVLSGCAGTNGRYSLEGFPPGPARLDVRLGDDPTGPIAASRTVEVGENGATEVDIELGDVEVEEAAARHYNASLAGRQGGHLNHGTH